MTFPSDCCVMSQSHTWVESHSQFKVDAPRSQRSSVAGVGEFLAKASEGTQSLEGPQGLPAAATLPLSSFPSPSAGDLRELPRVPLRGEGSGGFSRQEYWSGLPCLPPGDLPNLGNEPRSLALQVDSLPSDLAGKPKNTGVGSLFPLQGRQGSRVAFQTHPRWVGKIPWRKAWQPTPLFLPEELSWTEEPGGRQSMGLQRVRHD